MSELAFGSVLMVEKDLITTKNYRSFVANDSFYKSKKYASKKLKRSYLQKESHSMEKTSNIV